MKTVFVIKKWDGNAPGYEIVVICSTVGRAIEWIRRRPYEESDYEVEGCPIDFDGDWDAFPPDQFTLTQEMQWRIRQANEARE